MLRLLRQIVGVALLKIAHRVLPDDEPEELHHEAPEKVEPGFHFSPATISEKGAAMVHGGVFTRPDLQRAPATEVLHRDAPLAGSTEARIEAERAKLRARGEIG